ncbi:MAG: sulfatase-like hydrolase/transferase [Planctomycetota bacterium]
MTSNVGFGLCLFLWLTASLVKAAAKSPDTVKSPNVVVILTDDQGTLDAGCYGATDLHTPHIDALAQRGVRFTQAYSHMVCCPARAMLLTGRYPQRGNVNSWVQGRFESDSRNMFSSEITIAEVLKDVGYRTALFGKWHLGSSPGSGPTTQGFDEFFGIRAGFIDNYNHFHLHDSGYHTLFEGETEVFRHGEYFPDLITQRSINFIEENQGQPFFLYYAMNIPHYPEQSIRQFASQYADLPEPRRSYASIVSTTDHYIGQIIDTLDRLGVRDNTMVIYTSDNGYSAEDYQIEVDDHASGLPKGHNYGANGGGGYSGKWLGTKASLLEGGIRVPAIVSYPNQFPEGHVRDQLITAMDWLPTIIET